jgi:hypothetical protein
VTCEAVENCREASITKFKPVMAAAAMGETAMLPVIVEVDPVAMPLFARIA